MNDVCLIDVYDYDPENDSLFFFYRGMKYESSIHVENIIVDLGEDGSPVGAEILHASEMFEVSKEELEKPINFYAEISVSEETIEVDFTLILEDLYKSRYAMDRI